MSSPPDGFQTQDHHNLQLPPHQQQSLQQYPAAGQYGDQQQAHHQYVGGQPVAYQGQAPMVQQPGMGQIQHLAPHLVPPTQQHQQPYNSQPANDYQREVPSGYPAHALPGNIGNMHYRGPPQYPPPPNQYPNHQHMMPPGMGHGQPLTPPHIQPQHSSQSSDLKHSQDRNLHTSDQQNFYPQPNYLPSEQPPEFLHPQQPPYQYDYNPHNPVNFPPNFYGKNPNMPESIQQSSGHIPSQPQVGEPNNPHLQSQPHMPPHIHPQSNHHPQQQMGHTGMSNQFGNVLHVDDQHTSIQTQAQGNQMNPNFSQYPIQHITGPDTGQLQMSQASFPPPHPSGTQNVYKVRMPPDGFGSSRPLNPNFAPNSMQNFPPQMMPPNIGTHFSASHQHYPESDVSYGFETKTTSEKKSTPNEQYTEDSQPLNNLSCPPSGTPNILKEAQQKQMKQENIVPKALDSQKDFIAPEPRELGRNLENKFLERETNDSHSQLNLEQMSNIKPDVPNSTQPLIQGAKEFPTNTSDSNQEEPSNKVSNPSDQPSQTKFMTNDQVASEECGENIEKQESDNLTPALNQQPITLQQNFDSGQLENPSENSQHIVRHDPVHIQHALSHMTLSSENSVTLALSSSMTTMTINSPITFPSHHQEHRPPIPINPQETQGNVGNMKQGPHMHQTVAQPMGIVVSGSQHPIMVPQRQMNIQASVASISQPVYTTQMRYSSPFVGNQQRAMAPPMIMTPQRLPPPQMVNNSNCGQAQPMMGPPRQPHPRMMVGSQGIPPPHTVMMMPTQMIPVNKDNLRSQPQTQTPPGIVSQDPRSVGMANIRMMNPEGMHLRPKQPGVVPYTGPMPPMSMGMPGPQRFPIPVCQPERTNIINPFQTSQHSSNMVPMSIPMQIPPQDQQQPQPIHLLPPGPMMSSQANTSTMIIGPPGLPPQPLPGPPQEKVSVPWGWKRLLLADNIVYFSPSGIQLKSMEEIKDYLFTEGTCKCGLDCPLAVESLFDFNPKKLSEVLLPSSVSGKSATCKHLSSTIALAQIQNNTGFAIRHFHNPTFNKTTDGQKRKVKKKKKPFSGVLVSQMLAAREAEKNRINEIIAQQKAQHEASLRDKHSSKSEAQTGEITDGTETATQAQTMQQNSEMNQTLTVPYEETVLSTALVTPSHNTHDDSQPLILKNSQPEAVTNKTEDETAVEIEDSSKPVTPPPRLNNQQPLTPQRNVHPAMLQSSNLMNLGNAAQIFGSDRLNTQTEYSPDSSRRSSNEMAPIQEAPRQFSLAEAMQAARRLNLGKTNAEENQETTDEHSTSFESERNLNLESTSKEEIKPMECDASDNTTPQNETKDEPVNTKKGGTKTDEKSDLAKNIEIRRLSNTDEGNKPLEPIFHSPEKEKRKNPMENLFSIVSGMEVPSAFKHSDEDKDRMPGNSRNSSPGLSGASSPGLGALRPQLKGKKNRHQYSTLPPLPHSPPPWVLGGPQVVQGQGILQPSQPILSNSQLIRPAIVNSTDQLQMFQQPQTRVVVSSQQPLMSSGNQQMIITGPPQPAMQFVQQPGAAGQVPQAMMQLIQTVNGPVLVPMNSQPLAIENSSLIQVQPQASPFTQASPGASSTSSSPGSSTNVSPTAKKKGRKRKAEESIIPNNISTGAPQQHMSILMSPSAGQLIFHQNPSVNAGAQQVLTLAPANQPMPAPGVQPQNILVNQPGQQMILSNRALVPVPQPQGLIYQQMPDGSLIQVQTGQGLMPQIITQQPSGNQQLIQPNQILINSPAGQATVLQTGTGTPQLIMTPQGLVQTIGSLPPDLLSRGDGRLVQTGQTFPIPRKKSKENDRKFKPKKKVQQPSLYESGLQSFGSEEVNDQESIDETDTSYEEPQPSTSKDLSPRSSSIQSNKVDSSGLNATPPHQKEGDFEQLRSKSPNSDLDNSYQDLDTSIDTSRHSKMSGTITPVSNVSFLDEKYVSEDEESENEDDQNNFKYVTSSSKRKKKKKKRSADDFLREQNIVYDENAMTDSPGITYEPHDLAIGDLVWGPVNGFPSWPGKLVQQDLRGDQVNKDMVWVCWFGTKQVTQVEGYKLKTLSQGLEDHHRQRKKSRRGRKMNKSLEKAIQEAMSELD